MVSLTCEIGSKTLAPFLMNGAGSCKTMADIRLMANSSAGCAVIGSATMEDSLGNPDPNYHFEPGLSVNSNGLRNMGRPGYSRELPEMVQILHASEKLACLSIAGNTPDEYAALASLGNNSKADMIEVNLGCPNKWANDGKQKRIAFYSPPVVEAIVLAVEAVLPPEVAIAYKLSYCPDVYVLDENAAILLTRPRTTALVCINSLANAVILDALGNPVIVPQLGGYGGLAGPAIRPFSLATVMQWEERIKTYSSATKIIAAGGISSASDIVNFHRKGAGAFQMTTAVLGKLGHITTDSTKLFESILLQLDRMIDGQELVAI